MTFNQQDSMVNHKGHYCDAIGREWNDDTLPTWPECKCNLHGTSSDVLMPNNVKEGKYE